MFRLGLLLFSLGAMMGDSEKLIIPIIFLAVGGTLMLIGQKKEEAQNEQDNTET